MGSSLSAEEEPGQKEELQASAAPASADCAQPPCPGGDGKASSDVVSVPVESSESKAAAQPGLSATETPSDTPVPPEPEEEAAPDSQVAPDRFEHNLGTSSPPLQLQSPPRAQRELSPESEALDLDATQVPGQLHSEAKAPRTLEQQMSLKPSDDERTEISKKISWILRHGAKKVNVNIDDAGWVNVNDLLTSDILGGTTEDKLLAMISESNAQKTRYEMEDDPKGGKRIRAISKSRRNAFARELREKEKKEREKKREEEAREQQRERETSRRDPERPEQRDERSERSERWDGREAREAREPRREDGRWWGETWQEGPTYEQQVREGFLPVWQGSRLVAMAKEHQTVRPGRRANAYGGKGFEGKGENAKGDKGDGKGYDFKNEAKGERKGRGKDEKGKEGKGKFEGKGFHMDSRGKGDGFKPEGFRHEGKEEEQHEVKADRYGRGSRQQRWRAVNDRDIIVRVGLGMETDIVGTLLAGSLVTQVGEDKIVKNGIARMFIESIEPNAGIKGWVTRSAEAAGGPVFFKPDRGNVRGEPRGKEGKVGKGSQFGGEKGEKGKTDSKGKGRRPVGEGETAGGRLDQPDDQQPPPVVASAESS